MEPAGPTTLQPRALRVIRQVRVAVERGADAGLAISSEGGEAQTVGSAPDCDLAVRDPAVSRYHLEVRHSPAGLVVADLGSTNGTWVGDVRIERATVPPGTRLRIGDTILVVDDGGARGAGDDDVAEIPGVVAASSAMRAVVARLRKLARVTTSVLLEGETGTGKEVVARALHELGPRRAGPFEVVDCGSLPPSLIAAQLFGYERGAFTGADQRRPGAFERADGGTVLLDEIGELPIDLQPALLGVLERRRFTRVGGGEQVSVDVRVLAATNRDLRAEVNAGTFRADLYHRLAVARVVLPPLRERLEDLEPLVEHLTAQLTGVPGNPLAGVMDSLRAQRWSGNVRELKNVVEAAVVLGELPGQPAGPAAASAAAAADGAGPLAQASYKDARAAAVAAFEHEFLAGLLAATGGNVSEAARRARMDRVYLTQLLKRHGLR
jgi:DNA-binding NtrC family response regulator